MTSPPGDATRRRATPAVVRAATAEDAAAITAVHLVSRSAAMPWLPALHTEEETARWVREVVVPTSRVWVAEEPVAGDGDVGGGGVGGGGVVGYAALDGDVLDALYLLPHVRRRGIGTRLLEVVRAASPDRVTLHVFARNAAARAFYERHGFVVVATDDDGGEEGLPDVTYRWSPRASAPRPPSGGGRQGEPS